MEAKNRFISGIKQFKSLDLFKGDEWTFPSSGVRIMDYNEKGLSVVFHKGNTGITTANLTNGELFHLPNGYVPIGNVTFNGIVYIASVDSLGNCQIGSYPSPNWDDTTGGFVREYSPLKNYNNPDRTYLVTNRFNFSTINQVSILAKKKYDGSVDLYLADYNNPNRVINTGFNQKGFILNTIINPTDFEGSNNQIPSTSKFLYPKLYSIDSGGALEYGMYHIYLRYKTSSKTTTKFIGKVLPIQVYKGSDYKNISGSYELSYDDVLVYSNKKIVLDFNNIDFDSGYDYIEIAIVRYSSDTSNEMTRETYLIDKEYLISDIGDKLTIDGREPRMTFTFDEIILSKNTLTSCKAQAIVDSRYYGAKWKGASYNKSSISEYISKIKIGFSLSDEIEDIPKYNSTDSRVYQHQNPSITYSNTGFFRGETYPFAAKVLMTDGSETEAFTMEGYYEIIPGVKTAPNSKGIYTFPNHASAATGYDDVNNRRKSMGVKFDMTDAIEYFNNNINDFINVVGIIFLRGDRIENLLYQGLSSDVIKGIYSAVPLASDNSDYTFSFDTKRVAWPWDKMGFLTGGGQLGNSDHDRYFEEYNVITEEMDCAVIKDNSLKAIFAPDYLFETNSELSLGMDVYLKKIINYSGTGGINPFPDLSRHIINTMYREYGHYENVGEVTTFNNDSAIVANASVIDDAVTSGANGMVSIVPNYNDSNRLFYEKLMLLNYPNPYQAESDGTCNADNPDNCTSRIAMSFSFRLARHLSLALSNDDSSNWNNSIFNVYKNNPIQDLYDSIVSSFNSSSTLYYDISNARSLIDNNVISYSGDCFLQRVAFRIFNTFSVIDGWAIDGDYATPRNHFDTIPNAKVSAGSSVSAIFECRINAAMRNEVDVHTESLDISYSYYPMIKSKGISMKAWLMEYNNEAFTYEGLYVNSGYNKINSDNSTIGASNDLSIIENERPTRIFFSPKSNSGEVIDNFRKISPIAYQDFPLENGDMVGVFSINDTLVSIQEDAINQHYLGQQKMTTDSSDIIVESSGLHLSDKTRALANYGSQHGLSMISIGENVFGFDFKKRIIWMIGSGKTDAGTTSYQSTDISKKSQIIGWLKPYIDSYSNKTDILDILDDNPINGIGINVGFNRRYKELNFVFHFKEIINNPFPWDDIEEWGIRVEFKKGEICKFDINAGVDYHLYCWIGSSDSSFSEQPGSSIYWIDSGNNDSLVILEEENLNKALKGDIVTTYFGESGTAYVSPVDNPTSFSQIYIKQTLIPGDDPVIVNSIPITRTIELNRNSLVYDLNGHFFTGNSLHNSGMYFQLGENMLSTNEYIVGSDKRNLVFLHDNEDSKVGVYYGTKRDSEISLIVSGEEKTRDLIKMFNNYAISTNNIKFKSIKFYTQYQSSEITPFIPIDVNLFYINPEYIENMWRGPIPASIDGESLSEMVGQYLKVTLTYDQDEEKSIKEFFTNYIISYQ